MAPRQTPSDGTLLKGVRGGHRGYALTQSWGIDLQLVRLSFSALEGSMLETTKGHPAE